MNSGIFLIQRGGELVEMKEQPYDSEDVLQQLLACYPNLLAGDQMNAATPRRWLLVRREMGVPAEEEGADRWSLDHLFLDQDAVPTLIEVKRSTDTCTDPHGAVIPSRRWPRTTRWRSRRARPFQLVIGKQKGPTSASKTDPEFRFTGFAENQGPQYFVAKFRTEELVSERVLSIEAAPREPPEAVQGFEHELS
jgi:hypothetical protein